MVEISCWVYRECDCGAKSLHRQVRNRLREINTPILSQREARILCKNPEKLRKFVIGQVRLYVALVKKRRNAPSVLYPQAPKAGSGRAYNA